MNMLVFDNGNSYELTKDDIKILKIALTGLNWCDVICSEERERQLVLAYDNLKNLFVNL